MAHRGEVVVFFNTPNLNTFGVTTLAFIILSDLCANLCVPIAIGICGYCFHFSLILCTINY